MYDSTDPGAIPASVPPPGYTMGYVDGAWADAGGMAAKYPTAIPVRLSAIPGSPTAMSAHGWDGEKGDYNPAQGAAMSKAKLAQGVVPLGYCSEAVWVDYQEAHVAIGVNPASVDWLVAAYPGITGLYPGSIGHQFIDHGTYDESVILTGWLPGRPVGVIIPPFTPLPEVDTVPVSQTVQYRPNQLDQFQVALGGLVHYWSVFNQSPANEVVIGPNVAANQVKLPATVPDQVPQVSVIDGTVYVSVQLSTGHPLTLIQGPQGGWGARDWLDK